MLWRRASAVALAIVVLGPASQAAAQTEGNIVEVLAPKLRLYENPDKSGSRETFNPNKLTFPIKIRGASKYNTIKVKIGNSVGWVSWGHVRTDVKRSTIIPCEGQLASDSGGQASQGMRGVGGGKQCR